MVLIYAIFFGLMLAVIWLGHAFIYFSLVRFFPGLSSVAKTCLVASLAVLGASFMVASLLSHRYDNQLTRLYYFFSSAWLGLALNLLLALALVWLIVIFLRLFGIRPELRLIGLAVIGFVFAVSLFGMWNARQVRIKQVDLKLEGLPSAWRGKSVVQLSDAHLGAIYGEEHITEIVARINGLKPEAVFLTGDYFDGVEAHLEKLAAPLKQLEAPHGVYFITGNHEIYLGENKARAALAQSGVKFLSDSKVDLNGLAVVGVDWPTLGETKDVAGVVRRLAPSRPSILLYHEPRYIDEIAATGLIDLMLAGHTHKGQVWPLNYIARAVYGKYYIGLHRLNDFSLHTTSGAGTWGPPLRLGSQSEIVVIKFN